MEQLLQYPCFGLFIEIDVLGRIKGDLYESLFTMKLTQS